MRCSFFYAKLAENGYTYKNVMRWSKKAEVRGALIAPARRRAGRPPCVGNHCESRQSVHSRARQRQPLVRSPNAERRTGKNATLSMSRRAIEELFAPPRCLAVINLRDKRFEYYDSLQGRNGLCLKVSQAGDTDGN